MTAKMFHVFFSRIANSQYTFKDGTIAPFTGGRYTTDNEAKAQELKEEIAVGNLYIYQQEGKELLEESDLAPDAEYRKQVIAEFLAKQEKIAKGGADLGNSTQGKLNVADTSTISEAAAASQSGASAAPAIKLSLGK